VRPPTSGGDGTAACVHTYAGSAVITRDIGRLRPLTDQHERCDRKTARTIRCLGIGGITADDTKLTRTRAAIRPPRASSIVDKGGDGVVETTARDRTDATNAVGTGLTAWTSAVTSATMAVVGLNVDASVVAIGEAAATNDLTASRDARTPRWTNVVTSAAMVVIGLVINASATTNRRPLWTSTDPRSTRSPCRTRLPTSSTMACVILQVDALTATSGLPCGTANRTHTISANLPRSTHAIALSAMLVVIGGIDALTATQGLACRTNALAVDA
jgi:hypothetical protein